MSIAFDTGACKAQFGRVFKEDEISTKLENGYWSNNGIPTTIVVGQLQVQVMQQIQLFSLKLSSY